MFIITKSYIMESTTQQPIEIGKFNMDKAYKLLGVYLLFYGEMTEHYNYLTEQSKQLKIAFTQLPLPPDGILLGIKTTIQPKLAYSMAATTLPDKYLHLITRNLYFNLLPKLGLNRHFPRVLITAPQYYGGIDLMCLADQQGYAHLDSIIHNLTQQTILSTFFFQLSESFQVQSGLFGSCW
jgi:hypothetical protein